MYVNTTPHKNNPYTTPRNLKTTATPHNHHDKPPRTYHENNTKSNKNLHTTITYILTPTTPQTKDTHDTQILIH